MCENDRIEISDLQLPDLPAAEDKVNENLGDITRNIEREHIASALVKNRWNQSATARALGLTLRQLRYRIEKLNLKQ